RYPFMGAFLQSLLLSNFMVVTITMVMLVSISVWALRQQEYAGYLLGWLAGIFLMLLLTSLVPAPPPADPNTPLPPPATLSFFGLIFPSALGFVFGFGALILTRMGRSSDSRIGRALTVAVLVSFTLALGYLILLTTADQRASFAIFALAFAIGALTNFIFSRSSLRSPMSGRML
ncbi:MAG TPA: hypothetical protein VHO69_17045, partial [Phototrophicaceae bacterium]|nr:hypothetical protein [Phototrophicaceae bacterium]